MDTDVPLFELVVSRGWFKKEAITYYSSQKNIMPSIHTAIEHFLGDVYAKEARIIRLARVAINEEPVPESHPKPKEETFQQDTVNLTPPPRPTATCRECGEELLEGAKFCPECGASISASVEPLESAERKSPTIVSLTYDEDLAIYDYIVQHGATISLSQAAEDLDMSVEEVKKSIERLKENGRLAE